MNQEITSNKLNSQTLPLSGLRLIEASAGTGKTYTIGRLYLRLLLAIGEGAFYRPLTVEEILVVTFTEAATNELRGRIRENIHQLRLACLRPDDSDSAKEYKLLLDDIQDKEWAAKILLIAERQMDEAAIFTIHGFCQRMLAHNAFESGVLFEQILIQDETDLQKQACADFWRRYCYPLSTTLARVIGQTWNGPQGLLQDISSYLQGDSPIITDAPDAKETIEQRHHKIITLIDSVKKLWLKDDVDYVSLIKDSDLNKTSYRANFVPNWIAEINAWAQEETQDYSLPKSLERFAQSRLLDKTKKGGKTPSLPVFDAIDQLIELSLTLRDILLIRAISEVRESITQEKYKRGEMGFDDLLTRLDLALTADNGELLAQTIRQRFPVAMIDEFQDTDPQQYRIFQAIYTQQGKPYENYGLLFIGDPKQAIYAFRGADIFTYIKARADVSAHYTLETNWRSGKSMVDAVNTLFSQAEEPFYFSQIPFLAVNSADKNKDDQLYINQKVQPALQFWLQQGEGVSSGEYEATMAQLCADQICSWLRAGQEGKATLYRNNEHQPVCAEDITVLVRSRREAQLIRDALNQLNIPSVFLSNRDSVFETLEAKDILWLLQSVLRPEKERLLRSALASGLFGFNANEIDQLNNDEKRWDELVDEFAGYGQIWQKRGILPMIRTILSHRHIAENLLATVDGERRLTDIMHISELLQESALELENEHALVRWLAQQIIRPNIQAENQQMRLESDNHLVKICTIHKSKGLEYPLVWLPFVCNYQPTKQALYHSREDYQAYLVLEPDDEVMLLADQERLAEDLRLLYVALTRAIYHCSVGVGPVIKGNRKKSGDTDLHLTSLGYLLQQGKPVNAQRLAEILHNLSDENIAVENVPALEGQLWQPESNQSIELSAREFTRQLRDNWRMTSYSGLQYTSSHGRYMNIDEDNISDIMQSIIPNIDLDAVGDAENEGIEIQNDQHSFPRGALAGTFLHSLFEELNFTEQPPISWLEDKLIAHGFSADWAPFLQNWLIDIFNTPLNEQGIQLSLIDPEHQQDEMQFYLPIETMLSAKKLDSVMRAWDPLSQKCFPVDFADVKGMLKGFIDLVFSWQGKFYVLDYKSNWLGESSHSYTQEAMADAMITHRYDLQYQLYSLALHRYLSQRVKDYDYDVHFGGVFYLFLRGIDKNNVGNGVYFYRPQREFIEQLDILFKGEEG